MENLNLKDLKQKIDAIETAVVAMPEWQALRELNPQLWDTCTRGHETVTGLIQYAQFVVSQGE